MPGGRVWVAGVEGYHAPVLEITVERVDDGDHAILCPAGELDAYSVAQFREAFAELAEESRVIVNLAGVQFMDSAGLGALIGGIAGHDAAAAAGWGALAGAVIARRRTAHKKEEASEQIEQQNQQAQQATAEQIENFKKAFSVCLEAKEYMVKY